MTSIHKTDDFGKLRTLSSFWGDRFTGTKAQLNAIGFGVGCLFPGEPKANKKKCRLPPAHGYQRVNVEFEWTKRLQSDTPLDERTFDVCAYHLDSHKDRREKPTRFATGVTLREERWGDTYVGTAHALILAGVIEERQLPGMPGCGKCTSTFDAQGQLFTRGSADWHQPEFKVVRKYGKKISVYCIVSEEVHAQRSERDMQKESAHKLACMEAKRQNLVNRSTPKPRPNLRLVWSV